MTNLAVKLLEGRTVNLSTAATRDTRDAFLDQLIANPAKFLSARVIDALKADPSIELEFSNETTGQVVVTVCGSDLQLP